MTQIKTPCPSVEDKFDSDEEMVGYFILAYYYMIVLKNKTFLANIMSFRRL